MESMVKNKQAIYLIYMVRVLGQLLSWCKSRAALKSVELQCLKFGHLTRELTWRVLQIFLANQQEHNNFLLHQVRF